MFFSLAAGALSALLMSILMLGAMTLYTFCRRALLSAVFQGNLRKKT